MATITDLIEQVRAMQPDDFKPFEWASEQEAREHFYRSTIPAPIRDRDPGDETEEA